jgi:hypothetical protein
VLLRTGRPKHYAFRLPNSLTPKYRVFINAEEARRLIEPMPHKYELTRPALRVLACCTDRRPPDPDDVRQLRESAPNIHAGTPIASLAMEVIRQQAGKRAKRRTSATSNSQSPAGLREAVFRNVLPFPSRKSLAAKPL